MLAEERFSLILKQLERQRTVTVQNGTAHAEVRYLFTADIAQAAQD